MKKILCIETAYLPPIQYLCKWVDRDEVYLEAAEHYQKGSYRNRCYLAGSHGPLCLSIPLKKGKNQGQSIREVQIDNSTSWNKHHWRSIQTCYGKAPFFDHYAATLQPLYHSPPRFLFDWNLRLLYWLKEQFALQTEIKWTDSYRKQLPTGWLDLRNSISPKAHRNKSDPDFHPQPYPQLFSDKLGFLPNLSTLDLLFCLGPESDLSRYTQTSFGGEKKPGG